MARLNALWVIEQWSTRGKARWNATLAVSFTKAHARFTLTHIQANNPNGIFRVVRYLREKA